MTRNLKRMLGKKIKRYSICSWYTYTKGGESPKKPYSHSVKMAQTIFIETAKIEVLAAKEYLIITKST